MKMSSVMNIAVGCRMWAVQSGVLLIGMGLRLLQQCSAGALQLPCLPAEADAYAAMTTELVRS